MRKGHEGGYSKGGKGGSSKGVTDAASVQFALKILAPDPLAAAIIGKGGETIANMRSSCQSKLGLTDQGDLYPSTDSRVFTAQSSSEENLNEVVKQVISCMSDMASASAGDSESYDDLKLKILVPRAAVGGVIGKGGERIKAIRERSGAKINISDATYAGPDADQTITIGGTAEALMAAMADINSHVQALSKESWFAAWASNPGTMSSQSYGGSGQHGNNYGSMGYNYYSANPGINEMINIAQSLPPYVMEDARGFALSCVVPSRLVGGLIGRGGAGTKEVQSMTKTKISIREIPDDPNNNSLNINGPLSNLCCAYMLMMKRYLDAEQQAAGGR